MNRIDLNNEIINVWNEIQKDVIKIPLNISSERALVFKFAWKYCKILDKNNIEFIIDFEKRIFDKEFSDGSFLDLYIEIKPKDAKQIVFGFEFKFLKSGDAHNTNQTESRIKIINDIKRLTWLKTNKKIDYGIFLCGTNELPYTYEGRKKKYQYFKTYNNTVYKSNILFPINDKNSRDEVECINKIKFCWNNIELKGKSQNKFIEGKIFSWLKPIIIK